MSRNHDAKGLRWSPRSRGTAAGGLVDTTVHDKGNGGGQGCPSPRSRAHGAMEGGQASALKGESNRLNGETIQSLPLFFPSNQDWTWDQRTRDSELEERGCVPSRPGLRAWAPRGPRLRGGRARAMRACGLWLI